MGELKRCPFCGGEAKFQMFETTCNVVCEECGIGTALESEACYKRVIWLWNRRTEDSAWYEDPPHEVECKKCGTIYGSEHAKTLGACPRCNGQE